MWTAGPLIMIERFSTEPDYLTNYLPGAAVLAIGIGIAFPLVSAIAVSNAPGGRFAGATAVEQLDPPDRGGARRSHPRHAAGATVARARPRRPSSAPGCSPRSVLGSWRLEPLAVGKVRAVAAEETLIGAIQETARDPAPTRSVAATPRVQRHAEPARQPMAEPRSMADFLAEVPLFAGLDPDARDELAERTTTVSLPAGEWLFRQGDAPDALYLVRSGRLEIVDETPGSDPRVMGELTAGTALGELALIEDSVRTASVRARRDARLIRVSRDEFESLLETSPAASRVLLRTVGDWLVNRGSRAPAPGTSPPATIAVVALDRGAAAAGFDDSLAAALGRLGSVHYVTPAAIPDGADPGQSLSELLDRLEADHSQVVLAGGLLSDVDPWTHACLRQADRVLLTVETVPDAGQRQAWTIPASTDLVMLGSNVLTGISELLDDLSPRATYRVRRGAERDEDIAVIARRLSGNSVGLVLSGGGARCFSQIGVIEELQAAGVRIDRIAGTSLGAFIGALLAQGLDPGEIDARCYEEWVRRNPLGDYRFPRTSLVRGKRARAMLERNLPGAIEDLPRGFFCVSVDILAAEVVQHRRGPLAASVGASMSLPIFAPPIVHEGRLLLDGALMDNLPTEAMAADGEGPIIAVDATEPSVRALPEGTEPRVPTLVETIYKVMLLSESDSERRRSFADLLIRPDYEEIGILEFHMLDRMRAAGRRAAVEALADAPPSVFG